MLKDCFCFIHCTNVKKKRINRFVVGLSIISFSLHSHSYILAETEGRLTGSAVYVFSFAFETVDQ